MADTGLGYLGGAGVFVAALGLVAIIYYVRFEGLDRTGPGGWPANHGPSGSLEASVQVRDRSTTARTF